MPLFLSSVSILTGKVADEDAVPKAVAITFAMFPINLNGRRRVQITAIITSYVEGASEQNEL